MDVWVTATLFLEGEEESCHRVAFISKQISKQVDDWAFIFARIYPLKLTSLSCLHASKGHKENMSDWLFNDRKSEASVLQRMSTMSSFKRRLEKVELISSLHYKTVIFRPDLWEWCASRRCHSARLRCCCSCAPALIVPLLSWTPSPPPDVPLSVTEARWQKWSARKPMGSSDRASTIFRMAPRSSSPTPACDRNSLSLSDLVALPSGIPGGVAPDRRFSLSAIAEWWRDVSGSDVTLVCRKEVFVLYLFIYI